MSRRCRRALTPRPPRTEIPHEGPIADLVWSDPDPEKEDFAISPRGAGYTFGAGVVHKFLGANGLTHVLRAHQLCMEGYALLFDRHLSTVWSAPNYCYRCGNQASILEVGPDQHMFFNVFDAAPENERDGPSQNAQANAAGRVSCVLRICGRRADNVCSYQSTSCSTTEMDTTLTTKRTCVLCLSIARYPHRHPYPWASSHSARLLLTVDSLSDPLRSPFCPASNAASAQGGEYLWIGSMTGAAADAVEGPLRSPSLRSVAVAVVCIQRRAPQLERLSA
jgi:hypothetical protein